MLCVAGEKVLMFFFPPEKPEMSRGECTIVVRAAAVSRVHTRFESSGNRLKKQIRLCSTLLACQMKTN